MTPTMDLDRNGKLDWVFNEYVYGTALPKYSLEGAFRNGENGVKILHKKLTQSDVSPNFKMPVPIYRQLVPWLLAARKYFCQVHRPAILTLAPPRR